MSLLFMNTGKFLKIVSEKGFMAAIRKAYRKLFHSPTLKTNIGHRFIIPDPFGNEWVENGASDTTINWVIPEVGIGSGGHLNIFRMIFNMENQGMTCRIIIDGETQFKTGEKAREVIRKHFFPVNAEVSIGRESLKPAWTTFATSWQTAYTVRDFRGTKEKFYFVQDFEPYFYPHGSHYLFAEQTYKMGFKAVTAGGWLAEKLHDEYGMETFKMGFSYDKDLYRCYPRRDKDTRRIFFYARPVTTRRAFELGLFVLETVHKKLPDVSFILAGWDIEPYHVPFPHLNAGTLALKELPDLYSQCDVSLIISCTNLSLLPLEIMACGCPVVINTGKNNEWLLNNDIALLTEPTVEDLSNALIEILENPGLRDKLSKNGQEFASSTSWEKEASRVIAYLKEVHDR